MPIATPEVYAEMLGRAKEHKFAFPAINCVGSESINAAIKGFAEHGLRGALAIHGRGVEIGDAQVQRLAHCGYAIGEGMLGEKGATQPEGGRG